MEPTPRELLTTVLKHVSRSFYLTLRVLPGPIRSQIGLAYLLARATDTIRRHQPTGPGAAARGPGAAAAPDPGRDARPLAFEDLAQHQAQPRRGRTAGPCGEFPGLLDSCPARPGAGALGPAHHHQRPGAGPAPVRTPRPGASSHWQPTPSWTDYTWRVAGCVGGFWTRLCREHLFPERRSMRTTCWWTESGSERAAVGQHPARPSRRPAPGPLLPA